MGRRRTARARHGFLSDSRRYRHDTRWWRDREQSEDSRSGWPCRRRISRSAREGRPGVPGEGGRLAAYSAEHTTPISARPRRPHLRYRTDQGGRAICRASGPKAVNPPSPRIIAGPKLVRGTHAPRAHRSVAHALPAPDGSRANVEGDMVMADPVVLEVFTDYV